MLGDTSLLAAELTLAEPVSEGPNGETPRTAAFHLWTSGNRGTEGAALIVLRSGHCRSAIRTWEAVQ
jgi:hypothetical protein